MSGLFEGGIVRMRIKEIAELRILISDMEVTIKQLNKNLNVLQEILNDLSRKILK